MFKHGAKINQWKRKLFNANLPIAGFWIVKHLLRILSHQCIAKML